MSIKLIRTLILISILSLTFFACGEATSDAAETVSANTSSKANIKEAAYPPELIKEGKEKFKEYCSSCHGEDAKGVKDLGKDIVGGTFIQGLNDFELLNFIKIGREIDDPDNTTGLAMLPKGGNPGIFDPDINAMIAFLRSVQE